MDLKDLKPAHETILEAIEKHSHNLEELNKVTPEEILAPPWHGDINTPISMEIGGLCTLLTVLEKTFVPIDKIDGVIAGLKAITYRHLAINGTVENLEKRRTAALAV